MAALRRGATSGLAVGLRPCNLCSCPVFQVNGVVRLDQELDSSPVRNASGYSENNLNSAMSTISQTHLGPDFSSGVVFVFTDLEGSTPMAEFDPKTFDYIMVVHDSIIRETLGKLSKDRLFFRWTHRVLAACGVATLCCSSLSTRRPSLGNLTRGWGLRGGSERGRLRDQHAGG